MSERVIVTSALPYANGPIHFGQVVGAYLPADVYVRFRRMLGDEVHYVCGTDEYGVAITLKAEQSGESYESYVDKWHEKVRATLENIGIDFDIFTGTAHHRNPYHRELAQQFFSPASERFLPDRYIEGTCYLCGYDAARGDECPRCGKYLDARKLQNPRSTIDGAEPVLRETTHWFLDLARARDEWLREWFESKHGQWKVNVENFVRGDLEDLRERPITRDLPWGVPVPLPDAVGKVLYVWFDAPIGYLSISKQFFAERGEPEKFDELWRDPATKLYHFIGKDNITFHAVVFPSMLHGTRRGWVLPENVPANEFFNLEGRKFNTSAGWMIPEEDVLAQVPVDALRYALCTMMPETADSEWTWDEFQSRVNDDLADNLGNFVSRTLRFIERFFDGTVPAVGALSPADEQLCERARAAARAFQDQLLGFSFRKACQTLMGLGNDCNRYYDTEQPWATIKLDGPDGRERAAQTMRICAEMIRSLAILAKPIMPETSATLLATLDVREEPSFDDVGEIRLPRGPIERLPLTSTLPKFEDDHGRQKTALFRKVRDAWIAEQKEKLRKMSDAPEEVGEPIAPTIDFDRFAAVDLRVGTVRAAEKHPKADRLLVLRVDLGSEERTLVAGIAASYAAEELVGRQVIVVANLEPRKLRGIVSEGMVLAADDADGNPRLLRPDTELGDGQRVH